MVGRIPYEPEPLYPRQGDDYHQEMEQARLAHLEAADHWEEQMRQQNSFPSPEHPTRALRTVMTMTENQA